MDVICKLLSLNQPKPDLCWSIVSTAQSCMTQSIATADDSGDYEQLWRTPDIISNTLAANALDSDTAPVANDSM